jgi:cellobiose-specific phosphotransferase system component IIA
MHAEDQMMAAETFRVMAEDFIEVYKRLDANK